MDRIENLLYPYYPVHPVKTFVIIFSLACSL